MTAQSIRLRNKESCTLRDQRVRTHWERRWQAWRMLQVSASGTLSLGTWSWGTLSWGRGCWTWGTCWVIRTSSEMWTSWEMWKRQTWEPLRLRMGSDFRYTIGSLNASNMHGTMPQELIDKRQPLDNIAESQQHVYRQVDDGMHLHALPSRDHIAGDTTAADSSMGPRDMFAGASHSGKGVAPVGGEAVPDLGAIAPDLGAIAPGAIAAAPGAIAGGDDTLPIWSWGICTGSTEGHQIPDT